MDFSWTRIRACQIPSLRTKRLKTWCAISIPLGNNQRSDTRGPKPRFAESLYAAPRAGSWLISKRKGISIASATRSFTK